VHDDSADAIGSSAVHAATEGAAGAALGAGETEKEALEYQQLLLRMQAQVEQASGEDGLRSLVWGGRRLREDEYEDWSIRYHAARTSSSAAEDRAAALTELCLELEENGDEDWLEGGGEFRNRIWGVTAVEDKLQEEVPQTMEALKAAGIKIWMLTGDRADTAENVGYATHLLGGHTTLLQITKETTHAAIVAASAESMDSRELGEGSGMLKHTADATSSQEDFHEMVVRQLQRYHQRLYDMQDADEDEERLAARPARSTASHEGSPLLWGGRGGIGGGSGGARVPLAEQCSVQSIHSGGIEYALLIDGACLTEALSVEAEPLLLELGLQCTSVIACRVSPQQKAQLVKLVSEGTLIDPDDEYQSQQQLQQLAQHDHPCQQQLLQLQQQYQQRKLQKHRFKWPLPQMLNDSESNAATATRTGTLIGHTPFPAPGSGRTLANSTFVDSMSGASSPRYGSLYNQPANDEVPSPQSVAASEAASSYNGYGAVSTVMVSTANPVGAAMDATGASEGVDADAAAIAAARKKQKQLQEQLPSGMQLLVELQVWRHRLHRARVDGANDNMQWATDGVWDVVMSFAEVVSGVWCCDGGGGNLDDAYGVDNLGVGVPAGYNEAPLPMANGFDRDVNTSVGSEGYRSDGGRKKGLCQWLGCNCHCECAGCTCAFSDAPPPTVIMHSSAADGTPLGATVVGTPPASMHGGGYGSVYQYGQSKPCAAPDSTEQGFGGGSGRGVGGHKAGAGEPTRQDQPSLGRQPAVGRRARYRRARSNRGGGKLGKICTLAVGDGANDVPMIQAASIGVGISGEEGLQAANAADASIGRFRFLQRLLLVHGCWNYLRICSLTTYTIYKMVLPTLCQYWFGFETAGTFPEVFMNNMFIFYGVFYNGLAPVLVAVLDQPVPAELLLQQYHRSRVDSNDAGPGQQHEVRSPSNLQRCMAPDQLPSPLQSNDPPSPFATDTTDTSFGASPAAPPDLRGRGKPTTDPTLSPILSVGSSTDDSEIAHARANRYRGEGGRDSCGLCIYGVGQRNEHFTWSIILSWLGLALVESLAIYGCLVGGVSTWQIAADLGYGGEVRFQHHWITTIVPPPSPSLYHHRHLTSTSSPSTRSTSLPSPRLECPCSM
jgi:phosphoglycolate phosphatase-like HAD superfamily hydrolase